MLDLVTNSGPITLGKRIGKGGEGEVYELNDNSHRAIKLYTLDNLLDREAKIIAMVSAGLANSTNLVSFPLDTVKDKKGHFRGFAMRQITGHKPLFQLYAPGTRKQNFPKADYRFLVRTAANIARAIEAVHHAGCVIGDINHSSILVSEQATVALIDADSFQFIRGANRFLCRVGVPEYTPPELQEQSLSDKERTINHDSFGLAVIIFQLLFMGRHPFSGTYEQGEITPQTAIKEFRFAYTNKRRIGMQTPPGAPLLTEFPLDIQNAFDLAFGPEKKRPNSTQWVSLLADFERKLSRCGTNTLHYYSSTAPSCSWCRIEQSSGVTLFVGAIKFTSSTISFSSSFKQFDDIQLIAYDIRSSINQSFSQTALASSSPRKAANSNNKSTGIVAILVGSFIVSAAPKAAIFGLIVVAYGIYSLFSEGAEDQINKKLSEVKNLDSQIQSKIDNWYQLSGMNELYKQKSNLVALKDEIQAAGQHFNSLLQCVKSHREEIARTQYLERFFIRDSSISGIHRNLIPVLASYGLETAADIKKKFSLIKVPGIGPERSSSLRAWVVDLEQKYKTIPDPAIDQKECAIVKSAIDSHVNNLLGELDAGIQQLKKLDLQVRGRVRQGFTDIENLILQRQKLANDISGAINAAPQFRLDIPTQPTSQTQRRPIQLNYAGQVIYSNTPYAKSYTSTPNTNSNTRPANNPPRQQAAKQYTATSPVNAPKCPNCGGVMVQRVAMRGRNAGGAFWGCKSYPRCRGTRSI